MPRNAPISSWLTRRHRRRDPVGRSRGGRRRDRAASGKDAHGLALPRVAGETPRRRRRKLHFWQRRHPDDLTPAERDRNLTNATQAAVDPKLFRQALGHFPPASASSHRLVRGRNIRHDGEFVQFAIARSAAYPLQLRPTSPRACRYGRRAKGYAVNVLTENQKDVSDQFARSRSKKWEGMSFIRGVSEAPALPGVAAVFHCAVWAKHDGGDHGCLSRK